MYEYPKVTLYHASMVEIVSVVLENKQKNVDLKFMQTYERIYFDKKKTDRQTVKHCRTVHAYLSLDDSKILIY